MITGKSKYNKYRIVKVHYEKNGETIECYSLQEKMIGDWLSGWMDVKWCSNERSCIEKMLTHIEYDNRPEIKVTYTKY